MNALLIKAGAVLALLVALYFAEQYIEGRGYDRATAQYNAAIAQQKAQAAATLATEIANTRSAEQALQNFKNTQEIKDATHQKTVADLSDRLRRVADTAGRLRDPQAVGCGAGGGGTQSAASSAPGSGADHPAQAGGLLSAELSGLLQRLATEADGVNAAYASCRADAYTVRAQP